MARATTRVVVARASRQEREGGFDAHTKRALSFASGTTVRAEDNRAVESSKIENEASPVKRWVRLFRTWALALAFAIGTTMVVPGGALAARSGGRMGGGSFRAASSFRSIGSGPTSMSSFRSVNAPSATTGAMPMRTSGFFIGPGLGMGYGMGYGMGGGFFNIIMLMMFASFISTALQQMNGGGDGLVSGGDSITVVKIQVGLLGTARSLQRDLERIADRADTSAPDGLHYVLQETVLALLRNPEYAIYGFAKSKVCRGPEQAEELFNDLALDERGKFEQETLVNVNNRKKATTAGSVPGADTNDYILVTIIAACDGGVKMPEITDALDMKTALKRLGAVRVDALQAVEVLWTPQEDGDVLTQTELLRDYPILVNL